MLVGYMLILDVTNVTSSILNEKRILHNEEDIIGKGVNEITVKRNTFFHINILTFYV